MGRFGHAQQRNAVARGQAEAARQQHASRTKLPSIPPHERLARQPLSVADACKQALDFQSKQPYSSAPNYSGAVNIAAREREREFELQQRTLLQKTWDQTSRDLSIGEHAQRGRGQRADEDDEFFVHASMLTTAEQFSKLKAAIITRDREEDLKQISDALAVIERRRKDGTYRDKKPMIPKWIANGPMREDLPSHEIEESSQDWGAGCRKKARKPRKHATEAVELPALHQEGRRLRIPARSSPPGKEKLAKDLMNRSGAIWAALETSNRDMQAGRSIAHSLPRVHQKPTALLVSHILSKEK